MENTFLLVKMLLEACKAAKMAVGGATVTANVRTLNPPSLELLRASGRLQLGEKHVSPRENDFGSVQSCQLGGAAVTAKVRTLNPFSLELLCAYLKAATSWRTRYSS